MVPELLLQDSPLASLVREKFSRDTLEDKKNSLLRFLNHLEVGAYIVDLDRTILYWNNRAAEIAGRDFERVVGNRCQDKILNHEDRNGEDICRSENCPLDLTMRNQKQFEFPELIYLRQENGERISLSVFTFPLFENGVIVGGLELFEIQDDDSDEMVTMRLKKSLMPMNHNNHVESFYQPSRVIGGDLIYIRDSFIALIDVSGHGISSALVSTGLRLLLDELLSPELSLQNLGDLLEERFAEFGDLGMYFTGIFLKLVEGGVELVSFGHPAPIMIQRDGPQILEIHHDVLVGWNKPHFNPYQRIELGPDDSLLLYSDGITDLETGDGRLEEEGLLNLIKETHNLNSIYERAISRSIKNSHHDDISMVIVHGL